MRDPRPNKVEVFPSLAVRIRVWIPRYWVYAVDKALPMDRVCAKAEALALEGRTSVYLVLDEERALHYKPDGSWEISGPPRGEMCLSEISWEEDAAPVGRRPSRPS